MITADEILAVIVKELDRQEAESCKPHEGEGYINERGRFTPNPIRPAIPIYDPTRANLGVVDLEVLTAAIMAFVDARLEGLSDAAKYEEEPL